MSLTLLVVENSKWVERWPSPNNTEQRVSGREISEVEVPRILASV